LQADWADCSIRIVLEQRFYVAHPVKTNGRISEITLFNHDRRLGACAGVTARLGQVRKASSAKAQKATSRHGGPKIG